MRTQNFRVEKRDRGERSSKQESEREESLRWQEGGSEQQMHNVLEQTHVSVVTDIWAHMRGSKQSKGADFRAATDNLKIRNVIIGISPCVKITSLRQDVHVGTDAIFDKRRRKKSPTKKSKKGGAKGSFALVQEYIPSGPKRLS